MRLLRIGLQGELTFTDNLIEGKVAIPPYAILSHRWEDDHNNEVNHKDMRKQRGAQKPGWRKIKFCAERAKRDGLEYFWVDTCCIDRKDAAELTESINSMFRWYKNAEKCYVYLADVSSGCIAANEPSRSTWKLEFRNSNWFTRGWTLQELIAPLVVEFFSSDSAYLGNKESLAETIHEITRIPIRAFQGALLPEFSVEERISWSERRMTSRGEDRAYSLLGILAISIPVIYGEGEKNALERLRSEISLRSPSRVLEQLPIAEGAAFDSHANEHIPQCLLNTRTEVLREIVEWAQNPVSRTIYWLNGMAGTGKSTISRTLATKFSRSGALGATFFFKKGEADRGGMSKLLTTIVSQLIQRVPEIGGHVQAAMDADPTIISKAMREQFEKLVMLPVSKVPLGAATYPTRLVIIDALDECERVEDINILIKLLSSAKTANNLRLKFFLTSRPELPIRLGFKAVNGTYQDFILHGVADAIIEHDLAIYFKHKLDQIRQDFNLSTSEDRHLSTSWPTETDLHILVQMAVPLFIFAATVCLFVADRKGGNPNKKLQRVLKFQLTQGSRFDATYKPVLEQLIIDLPSEEQRDILLQFRKIVGPIVVLESPLCLHPLARLLDISTDDILDILDSLHSVLHIPSSQEQPIKLLHLSFRDFLVDPTRHDDAFWVDEKEVHRELASRCLYLLNGSLRNNICQVQAPGALASSIPSHHINASLASELQYACRFWTNHLQQSGTSGLHTNAVWKFLSSHFLQWLEALSWLGRLSESLRIVKVLQALFPVSVWHEYVGLY